MAKSAATRSIAASTLIVDSVLSSPASASTGQVATFHTSAPCFKTQGAIASDKPPFEKLMAANRGEIATRIVRAASELGIQTAGIYAHEGKLKKMFKWYTT
jgi:pyruvate carboxylase